MKKFNKTTAAVVAGAIMTGVGAVFVVDQQLAQAVQTILTAGLVWLFANGE